ncbi:uncharacterized protein LOC132722337 [Ruditapes philippinarum]|uniref:uncharacterized protein LOC132722337 n=1 Tax=Ruditapes philippinarum TaxID=129788 RepID=UPI00295C071B|nr:uncharacterized protein LOC132722337 [Ruditapes philippinarum]
MWSPVLFCFAALIASASTLDYSHCTKRHEYNVLYDLTRHNTCMDVKTMFNLIHDIHHDENKPSCRRHIIRVLASHFGPNATTPNTCNCHGKLDLVQYHTHVHDGTVDHKDSCMKDHDPYRILYNQFFESSHHHAGHCRTHDSVWFNLDRINRDGDDHDGCQQDFMFHLRYSFEHHSDHCRCDEIPVTSTHSTTLSTTKQTTSPTTHPTTRPTTHPTTNPTSSLTTHPAGHHISHDILCLNFDSFRKLLHLGAENGCLSANSVWHYLHDLQVKDPECRKIIQNYLVTKYKNNNSSSHDSGICTCHEQTPLVDHKLYHLRNGSHGLCHKNDAAYSNIATEYFSHIHEHGCQNHDSLWQKLGGVNNHCSLYDNGSCTQWKDCQFELIIRATLQYPTDDSDPCVCSKGLATKTSTTTPSTTSFISQTVPTYTATSTQRVLQAPKIQFTCDKMKVIESVAGLVVTTHVNSSYCFPHTQSTDDAILLSWCNMTSPSSWKKGANIMVDCESSSPRIPTYIPIATFDEDRYFATGAQSGIFLGCSDVGIKMVIQKCNGVPEIVHIDHGTFQSNPRNYYVIVTN